MISFLISISNPWSKDRFKNLGCIWGKISKNKTWELEHSFCDGTFLDINLKYTTKQDHAGFELDLSVLTYGIRFRIYDVRHWDYSQNKWVDN